MKRIVQQSSDRGAACAAIKRARISLDNAARAFDKGCDDSVVASACQESMRWLETAIANLMLHTCLTCGRKVCDRQPEGVDPSDCKDWKPWR